MKALKIYLILTLISCQTFAQSDTIFQIGQSYYDSGDYDKAFIYFDNCIKSDSSALNCYEKAGITAYKLGQLPDARRIFIELEKRDSLNEISIVQLATIYDQDKNTPKAIKYYTKLTKLNPENSLYYRKLAQQYNSAGLIIDAFKLYNQAYKLNKKDLYTIKGIAEIFLRNAQYPEADSRFNEHTFTSIDCS